MFLTFLIPHQYKKLFWVIKENAMIGSAMEKGSYICVYDENGHEIWSKSGDRLMGFTSTTVTIKKGSYLCTYDEHGHEKFSKSI